MHIWFSGIGGVGIGSLAALAADAGSVVIGSDREPSLTTAEIEARGIEVLYEQSGAALRARHAERPINRYVHTAALPDDHPELVAARALGIPTGKRDRFINDFLAEHRLRLLAVSGTHGKTTGTAMAIWALRALGVPVSWSIGTTLPFGPSGHHDAAATWFALECDEFDRNMLRFRPDVAVLPTIGYDHPDSYPSEADYLQAFRAFAEQSGAVFAWADQHGEVFEGLPGVTLLAPGEGAGDFLAASQRIDGAHNRRNAALVRRALAATVAPGRDAELTAALAAFPGSDRRFERLADGLYSDYGHHPEEILATLQLARELADRVVLVYQPHQNIRQHELLGKYRDQFELAERVFWLPTYLSREDPALRVLAPEELFATVTNPESVEAAVWDDALWARLEAYRAEGALVLGMGAGSIDGWLRTRLAKGDA